MKTKLSKRFIQTCGMLSGVMMLLFAGQAHALLIDTFDTNQGPIIVEENSITKFGEMPGGDIIGGERDIAVTCIDGCQKDIGRILGVVTGGIFVQSQDAGVKGSTLTTWDGVEGLGGASVLDPTGLGGIDFTDGGSEVGLYYKIIGVDVPVDLTFLAYTDAANYAKFVRPHTQADAGMSFGALYADFTPVIGAVDFTNIGALQLLVQASEADLDLRLDFIRTTGGQECIENCIPVETPEPGTWLLFGTGLMGIVGYGWRRNRVMA